jgi:hypothetical protein
MSVGNWRRVVTRMFECDRWPAGNSGAGEGIRTLDPNLGKVVLYP